LRAVAGAKRFLHRSRLCVPGAPIWPATGRRCGGACRCHAARSITIEHGAAAQGNH
jgi:hypothetical protein